MSIKKIEKGFNLIGTIEYELGKLLSELRSKGKYKSILGNHISNWKEALKELGITYARAQALIDVYETFPDLYDVTYFDRLKDIAKLYKFGFVKKDQLEELRHKAVSLTIKDWKDEYNILEGKSSYLECNHEETENFVRCLKCGRWIKI